jgi:hypothetical protein
VGNIRSPTSGVHGTGNDPNTLRARDSGRATNLEKRDAELLDERRDRSTPQMSALERPVRSPIARVRFMKPTSVRDNMPGRFWVGVLIGLTIVALIFGLR